MAYWQRKRDVKFLCGFRDDVLTLWKLEDQAAHRLEDEGFSATTRNDYAKALHLRASLFDGYTSIRQKVAQAMPRALRLADELGQPLEGKSFPPPIVGGPIITVNFFEAVLHDPSYDGVNHQLIKDKLDQVIGECEIEVKREFWRLFNPFYWGWVLLKAILRVPFKLIEATGFNVSKIEENLFGKLFKIAELLLLGWLASRIPWFREMMEKFGGK